MINQSFSYSSLSRCFHTKDFFDDTNLRNDDYRKTVIDKAVDISNDLFQPGTAIAAIKLGNKTAFHTTNLSEKLILRKCVTNIKASKNLRLKQRGVIGKELTKYLREGTPYRIYRFDIKSFFESIDIADVEARLARVEKLSTHTQNIIRSYLRCFQEKNHSGIPRGIEISPIISELLLQDFDKAIKNNNEVFYFSRFVDDIVIITSSFEDEVKFTAWIKRSLPIGLSLNKNKENLTKSIKSVLEVYDMKLLVNSKMFESCLCRYILSPGRVKNNKDVRRLISTEEFFIKDARKFLISHPNIIAESELGRKVANLTP